MMGVVVAHWCVHVVFLGDRPESSFGETSEQDWRLFWEAIGGEIVKGGGPRDEWGP